MIIPCGHRVVVRTQKLEDYDPVYASAKRSGILTLEHTDRQEQTAVDKGTVLSIGPTAFKDFGGSAWCKVGDAIAYARHAGKFIEDPKSKEKLLVINDEDIICVLKED